ncbi:5-(carboxyamino)imidazole ribonucleotide mutase [Lacticaseibacillus yichunensis]|uniref:N5-carboxyaminoimidazole ribonucleotide mutase n=1 Tax=Lacticaseibacillus yichunensis TaxID=2486015 RepID=A0ABW4CPR6_9LACO|nr:5-(carboxyamino)imidazole ribonucleotide mutase [Lacticaseibacillus yichunensis]
MKEVTSVQVAIVMGSKSDWPTMKVAAKQLEELAIPYVKRVISAHRMPDALAAFAKNAATEGIAVIIAGAGGAAHLPGMLAANTLVPVIGVPVKTRTLNGVDSLLSIVQMPAGVPVATMAIGEAGAANAALFAAAMLAGNDPALLARLTVFREAQTKAAEESEAALDD